MGRPLVCFGYKTALLILREANRSDLNVVRTKGGIIPRRTPRKDELDAVVECLMHRFPKLNFDEPIHVLVREPLKHSAPKHCMPHACTMDLSGQSFCLIEGICVALPPLALVQEATKEKNMISLLRMMWEACGSYQTKKTASYAAYDVSPLTSKRDIDRYVTLNPSLHGSRKVLRALRYLADNAASARETVAALVVSMPQRYGGYGTDIPSMNYKVMANRNARAISGKNSFRCDLCWVDAKLDVEYQSHEAHEGEDHRIKDSRRANALASMGWTVLGITNDELDSLVATDTIARTIFRHIGKRFQTSTPNHHARKLWLRRQLGLPLGLDNETHAPLKR